MITLPLFLVTAAAETTYPKNVEPCYGLLMPLETLFNESLKEGSLSDDDVDKVNLLLDEADEYCIKGFIKSARKKLQEARQMITISPEDTSE